MPRTSAVRQRDADEMPRTHSPTLCEGPLSQSKTRCRSPKIQDEGDVVALILGVDVTLLEDKTHSKGLLGINAS